MKIKLTIKSIGNPFNKNSWEEKYNTNELNMKKFNHLNHTNPQEFGQGMVDYYNSTLRNGEFPRKLINAEEIK